MSNDPKSVSSFRWITPTWNFLSRQAPDPNTRIQPLRSLFIDTCAKYHVPVNAKLLRDLTEELFQFVTDANDNKNLGALTHLKAQLKELINHPEKYIKNPGSVDLTPLRNLKKALGNAEFRDPDVDSDDISFPSSNFHEAFQLVCSLAETAFKAHTFTPFSKPDSSRISQATGFVGSYIPTPTKAKSAVWEGVLGKELLTGLAAKITLIKQNGQLKFSDLIELNQQLEELLKNPEGCIGKTWEVFNREEGSNKKLLIENFQSEILDILQRVNAQSGLEETHNIRLTPAHLDEVSQIFEKLIRSNGMVNQATSALEVWFEQQMQSADVSLPNLQVALRALIGVPFPKEAALNQAIFSIDEVLSKDPKVLIGKTVLNNADQEKYKSFSEELQKIRKYLAEQRDATFPELDKKFSDYLKVRFDPKITSWIKSSQKAPQNALYDLTDRVTNPQTGLLPQIKAETTEFIQDQLTPPNPHLVSAIEVLKALSNTNVNIPVLDKAIEILTDLQNNPQKYLGNRIDANDIKKVGALLVILQLRNGLALATARSFIQNDVLPSITKYNKQGALFDGMDRVRDVALGEGGLFDQVTLRAEEALADLSRTPHEELEKAHRVLSQYIQAAGKNRQTPELERQVTAALQTLVENPQKYFNPKGLVAFDQAAIQAVLNNAQGSLGNPLESTSEQLVKLDSVKQLLQQHIDAQKGVIPRTIDAAAERLEQKALERLESLERRFTEFTGNLFSPSEVEVTPLGEDDFNPRALKTMPQPKQGIKDFLQGALSYVSSFPKHLLQAASGKAVQMPCDAILMILDRALKTAEEQLEGEASGQVIHMILLAKEAIERAKKSGTVKAFQEAIASIQKQPVLLNNLIELPAFFKEEETDGITSQQLMDIQMREIQELENAKKGSVEQRRLEREEKNWALETDKQRELLEMNGALYSTYSCIDWFMGKGNPQAELDKAIRLEISNLENTPQYNQELNRLRVEKGYYDNNLTDENFCNILKSIPENITPEEQKAEFKRLLHLYIDRQSDVSAIRKSIAKFFLPVIEFVLENLIHRISFNMLQYVRDNIQKAQLEADKSVEMEPFKRTTDWFNTYLAMLQKYSTDQGGHNLETYLQLAIDDPEFNHHFNGDEIYSVFTNKVVDEFLPAMDLSSWVWAPGDWISNALKSTSVSFLALPLNIILGAAGVVLWIPSKLIEVILNPIVNKSLKGILNYNMLAKTIFEKGKFSQYEKTPFTYAIDRVLRDQLKDIWELMQELQESQESPGPQFEKVKTHLQELLKSAFKILETRGLDTREEYKKFFAGKASLLQKLERAKFGLITDDIIDSVSNLIFVAYQSILQDNKMEQQTALGLELINEALTSISSSLTPEEKRKQEAEYKQAKDEIQLYLDRILWLSVSQSVEGKMQAFGPEKKEEGDRIICELKDMILGDNGIVNKARTILQALQENSYEGNEETQKQYLEDLEKLRLELTYVMREIQTKTCDIEKSEKLGKASQKEIRRINEILTRELRHIDQTFIDFYQGENTKIAKLRAIPPMYLVETGLRTIIEIARRGAREGFNTDRLSRMDSQLQQLIRKGQDELSKIAIPSDSLLQYIHQLNVRDLEIQVGVFKNHSQLFTQLDGLESIIDALSTNKVDTLNNPRSAFSTLYQRNTPFDISLQEANQLIQDIPSQLDREEILQKISAISNAQSETEVTDATLDLRQAITTLRQRDIQLVQGTIDQLAATYDRVLDQSRTVRGEDLLIDFEDEELQMPWMDFQAQIQNALHSLERNAQEIKPIQYMEISVGDKYQKFFIDYLKGYIYHSMKEKSEAILELIRNPFIYDGLMRNLLLFNFVEKQGDDRRTINPR